MDITAALKVLEVKATAATERVNRQRVAAQLEPISVLQFTAALREVMKLGFKDLDDAIEHGVEVQLAIIILQEGEQ